MQRSASNGTVNELDLEQGPVPADLSGSSSPERGSRAWLVIALAFVLLIAFAFSQVKGSVSPLGSEAPPFTLSLIGTGAELSLAELTGSVVVVNFWASWCEPCHEEAVALETGWRTFKDRGVVFVGINFKDVPEKALDFMDTYDITYPNGPDSYGRISGSYRTTGVPETFFIGRDGIVAERDVGAITEDRLAATLERLLQEPADEPTS